MPALDQCHPQVINALEKAGWHIRNAPYFISIPPRRAYVDALLERGGNGSRERMFLLEIKCFVDEDSITEDLYGALGQYLIYAEMIRQKQLGYLLYLSVPVNFFRKHFDVVVMNIVRRQGINLVVIDLKNEQVVEWIR